jgi:hypothetical protein
MSDKKEEKKEKKSKWFSKKQITTPLQILNNLLELEGDKRLQLKEPVKKTSLGKVKEDNVPDFEKWDKEEKPLKKDEKKKEEEEQHTDTNSTTDIPIEFQNINKKEQQYISKILPQLNEIYNIVRKENRKNIKTQQDEVRITTTGVDESTNIINIENVKSVRVDPYIPPLK